jgi:hypothetical protein
MELWKIVLKILTQFIWLGTCDNGDEEPSRFTGRRNFLSR